MAIDDMVKIATGMSNGTEYLRSMVNFATAAPTAREKRDEADMAALNKLTEASDSMVIDSMSDEERKALSEIKSPSVRFKAVEEKRKAMKMEYGQEQDALKRDDKIENRDYQRDWAQFKTALAQNNFDVKRTM
jgi:hypothetical protein